MFRAVPLPIIRISLTVHLALESYVGLQSNRLLHTARHAHTSNVMLPQHRSRIFTFLKKF